MRLDKIKYIRQKLLKKEVSIGTWQQIPHASISEILGKVGYDWVAIDMEHGSINLSQLPDLFRALELGGSLPLVRISEPSIKECKQSLDAGAGGIIAPMIENADQLRKIRDACYWPPKGNRGVGFSRANLYGKNFEDYKEESKSPLIIAQIESIKGVNNLSDILKVKGLDAIIIGPYDLSASLGITASFKSKLFLETITKIIDLSKKNNIPCGYHLVEPDKKLLTEKINEGYTFLAYSTDAIFIHKYSDIFNIK